MNRASALSRRSFLTTAGAASLAAVTPRVRAAAAGANSDVRLLVVGCNRPGELRMGQGTAHIKRVLSGEVKGVRLAGICDVDPVNRDYHKAEFEKKGLSTERALRAQAERSLLEARKLRRCAVLGARHARGRLSCGGEPLPIFLPEPLAARLPASLRLRVRVLARVHGALEPDDRARVALHAVAVALVTRR